MDGDALIAGYLGRLDAATNNLVPSRRAELHAEVADHIEAGLAESGDRSEAAVRTVLDRLGAPEEIAAAEAGDTVPGSAATAASITPPGTPAETIPFPGQQRSPWGALEILAILMLTVGSVFLPFVGPIIGLVLAWASTAWTTREKVVATVIVAMMLSIVVLIVAGSIGGLQ